VAGIKRKAKNMNVDLEVLAPEREQDYSSQIKFINDASSDNSINWVIVAPNHSVKLIENLKQLCRSNKKVIIVDTPLENGLEKDIECNCGFVGADNVMGGELAAKFIISKLKKGANILLIKGVSSHRTSIDREKGFLKGISQRPDIKILGYLNGDWERGKSGVEYLKFIRKNKVKIDAVFAYSDLMALGVMDQYTKKTIRPMIVGYDGTLEAQKMTLLGRMDATIVQHPEHMGSLVIEKLKSCVPNDKHGRTSVYLSRVSVLTAVNSLEVSK
jgi:ribose transport system substrate-binding protein